ncbi:MAG TPA: HAD hydrolase-like protein, partial [Sideroxyarcus sp.]|nr:HAD hydrolase-like protein [Sideroxyarcus sp.]
MAKRYDLIVFDWDGTVMDSTAIIAASIQAACRDLKLPVPDDETARHVIGLGLMQALRHAVPDAPEEMYEPLTQRYRHHFLSQNDAIPL